MVPVLTLLLPLDSFFPALDSFQFSIMAKATKEIAWTGSTVYRWLQVSVRQSGSRKGTRLKIKEHESFGFLNFVFLFETDKILRSRIIYGKWKDNLLCPSKQKKKVTGSLKWQLKAQRLWSIILPYRGLTLLHQDFPNGNYRTVTQWRKYPWWAMLHHTKRWLCLFQSLLKNATKVCFF